MAAGGTQQSVENPQAGRIDWTALLAVAALLTALAAVATTVIVWRAVHLDVQHAVFSAGLDSLWHCSDKWNSDDMADARSHAAAALLAGAPTADVNEVLDFFDQIAVLLNRGALDEEMVWHEFYWPMANYWFASQDYIERVQRDDPTAWADLGSVLPRLVAIEAQRKKRSTSDAAPSSKEIRDFLTDETGEGECTDDEEVRKTPL